VLGSCAPSSSALGRSSWPTPPAICPRPGASRVGSRRCSGPRRSLAAMRPARLCTAQGLALSCTWRCMPTWTTGAESSGCTTRGLGSGDLREPAGTAARGAVRLQHGEVAGSRNGGLAGDRLPCRRFTARRGNTSAGIGQWCLRSDDRFYDAQGAKDPVRALAKVQEDLAGTTNHDWPSFAVFGNASVCRGMI